ncbi:WD40-repeat-containing domain protein [Phlyctochytrium arcticum]|nr:WD40-repeat-containing domain protein [Phlyctochytrium arcticum]
MSEDIRQLVWGKPITCHAFNKDRSQVAICPNDHTIEIYEKIGNEYELQHTLEEHDKLVTSIDWAPESNRIVSCSQDRNAYVWDWNAHGKKWEHKLVLLRINRAATYIRWSPLENKFAAASGARQIAIGYFDEENNWWACRHIKKPIRSTVLSVEWHPDNILLIAGSTDMKARVFSAYLKNVDGNRAKPSYAAWGDKFPFNNMFGEYSAPNFGWVHSVAFSPSGDTVAYSAHDSTLSITTGANNPVTTIATNALPIVSIMFASENTIIGVGHDCVPFVFNNKGGQWQLAGKLDQGPKKAASANTAFRMFQQMDSKAQQNSSDTGLNSVHQNTITSVRPYAGTRENVTKFSTTGVDGKLVIWDLLSSGMANLSI